VAHAVAHSVDTVFLIATPIAALGFLVVLLLKEYPLRSWNQDGAGPLSGAARSEAEQASPAHAQRPHEVAIPGSTHRSIQQS
jgi:hypothetical protein